MNEDYWYYEEQQNDGSWRAVNYGINRDDAVRKMEAHKKEYPIAKLRIVHCVKTCVKTRTPYAKRRTAK